MSSNHLEDSVPEPWLTKPQLAEHLAVSDRWIEMQQRVGLPTCAWAASNRYRVSEVEAWIREHYNSSPTIEPRHPTAATTVV
jgi:hypothetical protein